jgi:hypothetical protein
MASVYKWIEIFNSYQFLGFLIVLYLLISIIYVYSTQFEKTITISEKYNIASGAGKGLTINNSVMDEKYNVYKVSNSLYMLHFTSAELMMKIEKGKTYTVKGYGWRVPILGWYPNIVSIK